MTGEGEELFDRGVRQCRLTHMTDALAQQHVLLRGPNGVVQIRYRGLPLFGDQSLKFDTLLGGRRRLGQQARALEQAARVIDGVEAGPLQGQRVGLRNALVAVDAFDAGLTYRETAMILYDNRRVADAWRSGSTAMKSEMVRRLAMGQRLRAGGYFSLLKDACRVTAIPGSQVDGWRTAN